MSNTICICCAGRMTEGGPHNPNVCPACEQLLEDDCAALELFMAEPLPAEAVARLAAQVAERKPIQASH